MKILVLGAGVVGVATAYQLLKDGHDVTVIDRASEAASFTSFANAGLVAPGHAYAWSSPAAPGMMLRSLVQRDQAIRFKPGLDPRLWSWSLQFLKQCNAHSAAENTRQKARLCLYSQDMLHNVVAETGVSYDGNPGGLVYFYRTPESFEKAASKSELLRNEGVRIDILNPAEVVALDPGLAPARDQISGALVAVNDESGDARKFSIELAAKCVDLGCEFHWNTQVRALKRSGNILTGVETDNGTFQADKTILSLGIFSPDFVGKLGLGLPIYPIKGYSVTLPVGTHHKPPRIGGVDEDNLLAYCPMGERLRLTATAEFAGYSDAYKPKDFKSMLKKAQALFPRAANFEAPEFWAGLRPMTPTGLPIVGPSPIENLWFNTGHGHMGWTMSCGTARILADQLAGRDPAIDAAALAYRG
ncbi:MAG: D-amino acid dehydrogenase [Fimbriimonadaceae bacterium]|nr:D-amino acid dehydrogenase [Alphaproteobacteria bacterium]